jgi:hypothetical protein
VGLITVAALIVMAMFAAAAQASSVTNLTVDPLSPTPAGGARTDYVIHFTTSASGALAAGQHVTITLPTNASVRSEVNSSVTVGGGSSLGNCGIGATDNIAICSLFSTSSIAANTTVTVELDGVTNPPSLPTGAQQTLSVGTDTDTTPAPANYTVVAPGPVSPPTVTNTPPTTAAAGRTDYVISFTTSTTGGGMSGKAHSQITITLPGNTSVRSEVNSSVTVGGGSSLGNCGIGATDNVAICSLFSTSSIAANTTVTVELDGVTNEFPAPAKNADLLTVFTTSDTQTATSGSFPIIAPASVSQPTVTITPPTTAAAGRTDYVISFTTSTTGGGMSGKAHSQITITLPGSTSVRSEVNSSVTVGGGSSLGNCGIGPTDNVAICSLFSTSSIAANTTVTVELDGVTNETSAPAGGTDGLTVTTTSDTLTSTPGSFPIVPAQSVSPLTVTLTNSTPGARANYAIPFTTSSSGGMSGKAHSQITVTLPSTASVRTETNSSVTVGGGSSLGNCGIGPTDNVAICSLFSTSSIAANTTVTVELDGVTNPSTTSGSPVLSVVTTSDTATPSTSQGGPPSPPPPSPPPAASAPAVSGGPPTTQTSNTANVSGSVNPEGVTTTAFVQYGIDLNQRGPGADTTLYDQSTPAQQVGSDSTTHTISVPLTGLVPGVLYHARFVATSAAGTTFGPDQTFTTAKAAAPPPPVLGKSQDIQPVSGKVFIRNAAGQFILVTGSTQIRSGTVIDAVHGALAITTALPRGPHGAHDAAANRKAKVKTQSGTFGGAVFKLTQDRTGLANLSLVEGAFKGAPTYASCKAHKAGEASAAALSSLTLQLLRSSAHGRFRTTGRYSAATVRGTKWTIADRCDGTLTHDITDSVVVNDFVHHKTIVLHAGKSYLAKARR